MLVFTGQTERLLNYSIAVELFNSSPKGMIICALGAFSERSVYIFNISRCGFSQHTFRYFIVYLFVKGAKNALALLLEPGK